MSFQAPAAFNQGDEMKSGVIRSLYKRIGQLHGELGVQISEAEKAGLQLEEVKVLILKSREKLTMAAMHVDYARRELQEVQKSFTHIDRVIGLQLEDLDLAAALAEGEVPKKQPEIPAQEKAKAPRPERQAAEIGSSTIQPAGTKTAFPPNGKPTTPLNELYSLNVSEGSKKPLDLATTPASKPTRASEVPGKTLSPFHFDEKKISTHNGDVFVESGPSRIFRPPPNFAPGSDQSNATVKPIKTANPAQKASDNESTNLKDTHLRSLYSSSTISIRSDTPATIVCIPHDFDHAGNLPGRMGTKYDAAVICDKSNYLREGVPVLKLADIPKEVSLDDIASGLAGGPLYRISANAGDAGALVKSVRITFIHRQHALDFFGFAKKHNGLAIKNCPKRIQVLDDSKPGPNFVSYTVFRRIMTENVTRSVYVTGLSPNFWTTEKFRELLLVAADKLRVEDPGKYRTSEPLTEQNIVSYRLGSGETGIEAVIHMRSLTLSIIVRTALHGLQHPEGFWKERCNNELGPTISPYDNPDKIPTLKAYWVRDPCDRPLDKLKT
ncbi:hypothetical protein TWF694_006974 [Orbilia ellipsospora]|uniref:Uncharacterized protein n=1 Tax=Orbilia ellipsospora TaxID=2528407 RepID=A0AAV9XMN4_9PEZI